MKPPPRATRSSRAKAEEEVGATRVRCESAIIKRGESKEAGSVSVAKLEGAMRVRRESAIVKRGDSEKVEEAKFRAGSDSAAELKRSDSDSANSEGADKGVTDRDADGDASTDADVDANADTDRDAAGRGGAGGMTAYEQLRADRMARNAALLAALDVSAAARRLKSTAQPQQRRLAPSQGCRGRNNHTCPAPHLVCVPHVLIILSHSGTRRSFRVQIKTGGGRSGGSGGGGGDKGEGEEEDEEEGEEEELGKDGEYIPDEIADDDEDEERDEGEEEGEDEEMEGGEGCGGGGGGGGSSGRRSGQQSGKRGAETQQQRGSKWGRGMELGAVGAGDKDEELQMVSGFLRWLP
ncbi:unnamed protein product [Closterium sp. NIES-54]